MDTSKFRTRSASDFVIYSWPGSEFRSLEKKKKKKKTTGKNRISFETPFPSRSLSIFTNPSARAGYDTRSIFKRSLTGLNSEFSFSQTSCLTKAEEPSLSYYLPIAGWRIIGFIPFPRVLVLCEMQLAWSRTWTRVAVSISYDDNHYTTIYLSIYQSIYLFEKWGRRRRKRRNCSSYLKCVKRVTWVIIISYNQRNFENIVLAQSAGTLKTYRQHLCRGVSHPQPLSWIWH